jgi:hypothetical protein
MLSMASCRPGVPSGYIQPDDMEDLLHDYHIAQAMAIDNGRGEGDGSYEQTLYFAAVLEKHGVTKAKFDSSLTYYYKRADRFSEMYQRVAKRLGEEAMELGASEGEVSRYTKYNATGDTADVWTGRLSVMLVPYAPYNRMDFVQKADTSFRKGDAFMFVVNTDFLYQNGARNGHACVAVKYDNDTIVSRHISLTASGQSELRIPELRDRTATEIRGYIYLAPEKEVTTTLKLMAIKDIQLVKFRKQKTDAPIAGDSARINRILPVETSKSKAL